MGANAPDLLTLAEETVKINARRSGPAKGAVPRLPDGTVNLMDGVWVGGGPVKIVAFS